MNDETQTEDTKDIGVGAMLRASRMRHGQDLRAVAAMLCVRYPYLEAIENGRYEELPGRTYAVGFIRAYADYLGLDSDEVVRRFKEDVAAGKSRTELHFPTPVLETSIPSGAIISVGIVIAVIAYGGWYMSTAEDGFFTGLIEPLPQRFSALMSSKDDAPEKPEATAPPPPAASSESVPAVEAPPVTEPTPVAEPQPAPQPAPQPEMPVENAAATVEVPPVVEAPAVVAAEPVVEPVVETVTVEPTPIATDPAPEQPSHPVLEPVVEAQQPDPQQITVETLPAPEPAPASKPVETPQPPASEQATVTPEDEVVPPAPAVTYRQITVRANSDSWFEIIDEFGGASLAARTLRAGEEYRVPNRSGLLLVTGNAGALEILIDGESVPAIGKDGAVLRGVRLNADMLLNGTAVAE